MTRMKDIAWPQPTYNVKAVGSPFGEGLNRAARRRLMVTESTRLERLIDKEERHQRIRQVTHKEPSGAVARRRRARAKA